MAHHPICIYLSPGDPKCQLSEPGTAKSRTTPHQENEKQIDIFPNKYSSDTARSPTKRLRRRPKLCSLQPTNLLKQTIFNRYPSILQFRLKLPDKHPSHRLKHAAGFSDLRKAAGYTHSTISTPEFPAVQTSLRLTNSRPAVFRNQNTQMTTAASNGERLQGGVLQGNFEQWKLPARVMVTSTMLQAYSEMRGNHDKENWQFGPLHESLFLGDRGLPGGDQRVLPVVNSQDSYPNGVCFYWDPSSNQHMRTPDPIIPSGDLNLQNNGTQSISPQKSLDQAPPGSEIRHYKGELGYGNYGYLLINNTWVDPDSEGEVTKALRDELLRTSIPHIPIVSDGAKIMTPEEQDKFYREYTRDVSLSVSGDLEGDPRFLRISPATFTRWAEGASKGDSYITTEVPNPEPLVRKPRGDCRDLSCKLDRLSIEPQYDMDTGSIMTGCYELKQEPSIIFSADGVDLDHRPINFASSYPGINHIFDRVAFGPDEGRERTSHWVATPMPSHQDIVFGAKGACNEFAHPHDPSGIRQFKEAKIYIETLGDLHRDVRELSSLLNKRTNKLEIQRYGIHREFFFMKKELALRTGALEEDLPSVPADAFRRSNPFGQPPRPDTPRPVMAIDGTNLTQNPGRYALYFKEREEHELVNIKKFMLEANASEARINPIMEGIQQLTMIHDDLKTRLGFSDEDASMLIPVSSYADRSN